MKGIILSAGVGSRLLPLTENLPKCLVEVDGRAILDHQLDALCAAGITEVVIVGGYRFPQIAEHIARSRPPLAIDLVFNPFWSVASSIGSVWMARDHLDAPFCLMNGDTVFDASVVERAIGHGGPGLGLLVEPLRDPQLDDMLAIVTDGLIEAVAKDLPVEKATHRSLGVILSFSADGAYRDALEQVIAAPGGLNAYHHAIIARLAATYGVSAVVNDAGAWQEIDRPEDISGWTRDHHRIADGE